MVKKKSVTGRRRKNSNTTTPQNDGAKRSKTEEMNSADYRNGILHGLRVILQKMDDKELLAVMAYVSSIDVKQQKSTTLQEPSLTATATASVESTATATVTGATVNTAADHAANPSPAALTTTTTEAANLPASAETTTVPPSPQDSVVIQLNKKTRPQKFRIPVHRYKIPGYFVSKIVWIRNLF